MTDKLKKTNWKNRSIAAIVVLLIELFIWNHSFWLTLGYEPVYADSIYTETGAILEPGMDYVIGDNSYLEIRDIHQEIKNVYLDIWTGKEYDRNVLTVTLNLTDEGSKAYYGANTKVISPLLDKCNYISIYPYGELNALKLTFPSEKGTEISVIDISFNHPVPMFFSVWRVLLMYLLYLLVCAFFCKPYNVYYQPDSRKQKGISVLLFALCTAVIVPLTLVGNDDYGLATMDKYTDLAYAFAYGRVSVEEHVDERLLSAENPYDRTERKELGVGGYRWDYAYFGGKIYVYFGVVPVILMYLPYYLITLTDLPHLYPYLIFLIGLIAGAFLLTDVLIRTYCRKIPLKLYYLLQITFMLGIGTLIFAKRVCIYNMAIMAGVCFTVWGLYLWLSYCIKAEKHRIWKLAAGSLCMALVAGCRPQLLLASFLALSIFAEPFRDLFCDIRKKQHIGRHISFMLAFCIPYIVVAAFLMWYNAARFGSPFDFGAAYNLTTNDMTKRSFHFARFIPGIWSFLFQPPSVNIEFPFIRTVQFQTYYQGNTIHESLIGGLFATNLILLPCFLFYHYRARLKEKKVFAFTCISLISALAIVCADIQMAGILTRYLADFSILFYLAAFMIIFTFIDRYYAAKDSLSGKLSETAWCRGIALLCCITILYLVLSVFSLYVSGDYDLYRPVWFYHMKEIFGVFDV